MTTYRADRYMADPWAPEGEFDHVVVDVNRRQGGVPSRLPQRMIKAIAGGKARQTWNLAGGGKATQVVRFG